MVGRRRGLPRSAAPALFGAVLVSLALLPGVAGATFESELRQCQNRPAPGDEGEAELSLTPRVRKGLARSRLSSSLVRPARWLGGTPVYPVPTASEDGGRIEATLRGGFVLQGQGGRRLGVRLLRLTNEGSVVPRIEGRIDGRKATIFRVKGISVRKNEGTGQVELEGGRAILAPAMARQLKRKAGFGRARPGSTWGRLYLTWDETMPYPVSVPDVPADFPRPAQAEDLAGATLTWRVRPSWIGYVASGSGSSSKAVGGAIPGEPEIIDGPPPLVYDYTFPFSSGWVKDGVGGVESASVKGSGGVYFRYCGSSDIYKGLNFIVHSPELELDGSVGRLIFRVEGIDLTPFPDSRAVVVKLGPVGTPSQSGGGIESTWTGIAGAVPLGSLGIFGGFTDYARSFGSVDVTITRGLG